MTDRAQRAAEAILTDPSLTDNFDDAPAQVLIDWGVQVAKRVADYTGAMDDEAAISYIDDQMAGVRKIMRRINKLYGQYMDGPLEDLIAWLEKVYNTADEVAAVEARPLANQQLIAKTLQGLTPGDGIRQIVGQFVILGEVSERLSREEGLVLEDIVETPSDEPGVNEPDTPPISASPAGSDESAPADTLPNTTQPEAPPTTDDNNRGENESGQ